MDKQKVYFPNLNGLRFLAAFLVIIHHLEQIKSIYNINSYFWSVPFVGLIGKIGVILFFVLSGFLITYLLLTEEHIYKNISIKKFYIRRILRIWPLYFLIILISLLILPHISIFTLPGFEKEVVYKNLFLKIFLYIIFFPNLVFAVLGNMPYSSHTWSVGTEEQFYLVWPVILKFFKNYRIGLMIFIVFSYLFIAKELSDQTHYTDFLPYKVELNAFWSSFNIDCMAIGGFFAILLFQKNRFLKLFMNRYLFYFTIILLSMLMIKGIYLRHMHYEGYAFLFGIVILNFAANDKIYLSLENKPLNYLGKISYGIYMYHPIGIVLSILIAKSINYTSNFLLYPLSVLLTILLAAISYKYFESIFLKFKIKFSKIISGDDLNIKPEINKLQ